MVWNYIPNVTESSDDKKKYNACNEHNFYKYKSFGGELDMVKRDKLNHHNMTKRADF